MFFKSVNCNTILLEIEDPSVRPYSFYSKLSFVVRIFEWNKFALNIQIFGHEIMNIFSFQLKYLSFDELKGKMGTLDQDMEREIDDLRRRYHAKRQPILDAMDQKRKRQQNFWNSSRRVLIRVQVLPYTI